MQPVVFNRCCLLASPNAKSRSYQSTPVIEWSSHQTGVQSFSSVSTQARKHSHARRHTLIRNESTWFYDSFTRKWILTFAVITWTVERRTRKTRQIALFISYYTGKQLSSNESIWASKISWILLFLHFCRQTAMNWWDLVQPTVICYDQKANGLFFKCNVSILANDHWEKPGPTYEI